ncbi:MAG: MATE family efflux transporter [Myxococcota bacterium]
MLRSPHDRDIARLAVPAVGALAIDPLVSVVDTAFVTQLGEIPLAALGVCTGLFGLAFFVFNFLAYGTTPLVAAARANDEPAQVGRIVGQSLTLAVVLGLMGMVVLEVAAEPLVRAMGATDALAADAAGYLRARAWATPAVLLITAGNGAYRGLEDTVSPLLYALALNVVNLVLDPVLMFGFGWGLTGAAVASAIAQWIGAGLFLTGLLGWHGGRFRVPPRLPRPAELLPLIKVGGILSIRTFALVGTLTLATAVATRVSIAAIGAHQIAWQLWGLAALIVDALAVAGQALVARYLALNQPQIARQVSDRLLTLGIGVGLVLAIGLAALGPVLPWVLSKTPASAVELQKIWWIVVFMQPLNAAIFVWDGVYLGARRFGFVAVSMVIAAVIGSIGLGLVLPLGLGLAGVWGAMVALNAARAIGLAAGYRGWGKAT